MEQIFPYIIFGAVTMCALAGCAFCLWLLLRTQRENQQLVATLELREQLHKQEQAHAAELNSRQQAQWQENLVQMEERFKNLATEILSHKSNELKNTNNVQLGYVLTPLQEQLRELGRAVAETNKETACTKMALSEQLRHLFENTARLGSEAQELSRALRGDSKKQGDWGEMLLADLLEKSGLQRGEQFVLQEDVRDENNASFRPDAIVRFPGKRCVIVDAKVSLSAYTRAVNAENEADQKREFKAHTDSVRKHVNELAAKNYPSLVEGAAGYVLMFIPNEASYMAAIHSDPELINEAYRKGVIIVNPANLLMALQLAYNLWQNELQVRNIKEIVHRAESLYEKLVLVQESFSAAKTRLNSAVDALNEAENRLSHGKGSFARQVEMLRDYGINPKKRLNLPDAEED